VREEGLEPSCLSTLEPKSSASTSFAILAATDSNGLRHFEAFVYRGGGQYVLELGPFDGCLRFPLKTHPFPSNFLRLLAFL
jgi:hypothetical protein